MLSSRLIVRVFAGVIVVSMGAASGQTYPTKPVRIVTAPAGGGADFLARLVAQGIAGPLGQPVIVDNRTPVVGIEIVTKAPPDGYTLQVSGANLWIGPLLRKVDYDAVKDFSPVSQVTREVNIVAVNPALPVKSVKELIDLAKAKPGELNFSSGSTPGTSAHLSMELFKSLAGVNIVGVPYKGSAPAIAGAISGEVQAIILDAGSVMPQAKAGKLRALAVTSATPSALAPGLPTVAATGLPGYESISMTGIFAPARTPSAVTTRLSQEIARAVNKPEAKERLLNAGAEAVGSTPQDLGDAVKADIARWGKVIKDAGIKVE